MLSEPVRILVVEDETDVASLLKRALEEDGHTVTVAMDGHSAMQYIDSFTYELLIFDVMLPGINGIELCRHSRKKEIQTPILLLTALGSTDNVVIGLDNGADDYLTKPFKLAELSARVRALLRRTPPAPVSAPALLQIGDMQLNRNEKFALRSQQKIDLTATEYRLLEYLMSNPKKVLSRMEILEKVWGYDFQLNTKVVDVYINYLRKKLERDGGTRLIHTVVGMGYIFKEMEHEHTA